MIEALRNHKDTLVRLCRRYKVKRFELFGSALSGAGFDSKTSDIDFLVEFQPLKPQEHAKNYFKLLEELQDTFGCDIDLVETKALHNPYLLESINKNRTEIYAA